MNFIYLKSLLSTSNSIITFDITKLPHLLPFCTPSTCICALLLRIVWNIPKHLLVSAFENLLPAQRNLSGLPSYNISCVMRWQWWWFFLSLYFLLLLFSFQWYKKETAIPTKLLQQGLTLLRTLKWPLWYLVQIPHGPEFFF